MNTNFTVREDTGIGYIRPRRDTLYIIIYFYGAMFCHHYLFVADESVTFVPKCACSRPTAPAPSCKRCSGGGMTIIIVRSNLYTSARIKGKGKKPYNISSFAFVFIKTATSAQPLSPTVPLLFVVISPNPKSRLSSLPVHHVKTRNDKIYETYYFLRHT